MKCDFHIFHITKKKNNETKQKNHKPANNNRLIILKKGLSKDHLDQINMYSIRRKKL